MILAPVQALFGMRLIPQKLLVMAFALGAVWLLMRIARRRLDNRWGPWIFLAAATLIPTVEYAHYVMSEIPFLFFFLGAVDACDRWNEAGARSPENTLGKESGRQEPRKEPLKARGSVPERSPAAPPATTSERWHHHLRTRRTWEVALWIAAAFYTRTVGAAIGIGILLSLRAARRGRAALALAAVLTLLGLPWVLHALSTPGGSPYFHQLLQVNPYYPEFGLLTPYRLLRRLGLNGRFYLLQEAPLAFIPLFYRSTYSPEALRTACFPWWLALPLLVPFAAGIRIALRRRDPAVWCLLMILLVCLLWPLIWAGSRFLIPVVPLLLIFWWTGWNAFAATGAGRRKEPSRSWNWLRAALLALVLALGARNLVFYSRETREYPPEWDHYFTALRWIRDHTPAGSVVVDRKPGFVEFVAERKGVSFPREKDPDRMLQGFREDGVTHVVLSSLPYDDIGRYLQPAVNQRRDHFAVLYRVSDPDTYVLGFHPEGGVPHGTVPGPDH